MFAELMCISIFIVSWDVATVFFVQGSRNAVCSGFAKGHFPRRRIGLLARESGQLVNAVRRSSHWRSRSEFTFCPARQPNGTHEPTSALGCLLTSALSTAKVGPGRLSLKTKAKVSLCPASSGSDQRQTLRLSRSKNRLRLPETTDGHLEI